MPRYTRLAVALALGLVLTWGYFAGRLLVVAIPITSADAIVSLASHEWERLPATAVAAARFPNALVILTLPTRISTHNCHDCEHRVARLVHAGVKAERIRVIPLTVEGTLGEAQACAEFLRRSKLRALLVVTSAYHTRRALAVFRHELAGNASAIGIEPASRFSAADPSRWWRHPFDRWYVAYEWTALLYYAAWHHVMPAFDVSAAPA